MQLMANELRNQGLYAKAVSFYNSINHFENDINIYLGPDESKISKHYKKIKFSIKAIREYDIFHFHFRTSLYGNFLFDHIDIPLLKILGKKVFMHFRGSDLIDQPYYLSKLNSGLFGNDIFKVRKEVSPLLTFYKKYCDGTFLSTPNMKPLIKNSKVLPQIISIPIKKPRFNFEKPLGEIRIAHAPTNRSVKGTKYIIKAVDSLISDGYDIKLLLIESIPHKQVIDIYKRCHIGIDQLFLGWYGKVSIELMMLGKPVFCYLSENILSHQKKFEHLPIINVNHINLENRLRHFLDNWQKLKPYARDGFSYVKKYHSQKSVSKNLINFYARSFYKSGESTF